MFAPLGFVRGLSDEQIDALADPAKAVSASLPTIEDGVAAGSWLVGPPERIVEQLQEIQERLPGLEAVNLGPVVSTSKSVTLEQLDALGREVIPAFRGANRGRRLVGTETPHKTRLSGNGRRPRTDCRECPTWRANRAYIAQQPYRCFETNWQVPPWA